MRFFGIFSRTREFFWLKLHTEIVLNIIYNFCKDCMAIFAYWRQSNQEICQKMRFFDIISRTRENIWLKLHTKIVLNITYNFSTDTKLQKFHLHPFWGHFSIWLQSICVKNDFSRKVFKIDASNFPEMFIRWFSTTFVKTVWWFLHIDGSQIKKTAISYKKNHFFLIFLRNTLDTRFKLSRNVYQMILHNFCKDCMVIFAYWRQSNQEICQKMKI